MKAVVGVDLGGAFKAGLALFDKLKFPDSNIRFLNVVEPLLPDGGFPEAMSVSPMAQILDDLQKAGAEVLSQVAAEHPGCTQQVVLGSAAGSILEVADELGADMIVVGSQRKSLIESLFVGSVTKHLTLKTKHPLLVGKKMPSSDQGLVVVFAHDMSEYADKAVDHLVALAPKGISRLVLVTADTTDPSIVAVIERNDASKAGETLDVLDSRIDNRQSKIAARLKPLCADIELVVSRGDVNEVLRDTMTSTRADLLIMGAQGHNFLERLVVGSVAVHQVMREPYSVLIVRA